MSLVEAAAALDRLLLQRNQVTTTNNTPPYAPPLNKTSDGDDEDDGNLLPSFFPSGLSQMDAWVTSTPVEGSFPNMILPWEDIPTGVLEDSPIPVTPISTDLPSLLSSIALIPPNLSVLPSSDNSSPHSQWVTSLDQHRSIEGNILSIGIISQTPQNTSDQDIRKRRHKRKNTRGEHDGSSVFSKDFIPLDPEKYKTELCRSFQVHSYCRYGVRCNYAHGLEELRGASRHGKYKTHNCKSYHGTGFCRFGARCCFIHDPEEGILKCSISNKEILETLHYRPPSEDSPRTAHISWRFLEAVGEPASELNFITCTETSQEAIGSPVIASINVPEELLSPASFSSAYPLHSHINLLFSSEDGLLDDSRLLACSFPIVNDQSVLDSAHLLKENLNLLLSLQVGNESRKLLPLQNEEEEYNASSSSFDASAADQSPIVGSSCLLGPKISSIPSWPLSPIGSPRIQELGLDGEPILNDPYETGAGTLPSGNFCQEFESMEIVQTILKRGHIYSATMWSDGTDIPCNSATESSGAVTQSKEITKEVKIDITGNSPNYNNFGHRREKREGSVRKRKKKNPSRRQRKMRHKKKLSESENHPLHRKGNLHSPMDDNVFFSTFQTDFESDLEDECKVSTDAAGPDGDEWSEKSSLHLADLLRSLHLSEDNNRFLPSSKSGRRYSSDGSSSGLFYAKNLCSGASSPASPRQHDMTKYKTEFCRSFQYNGYCSYGAACLYAHGPTDLRSYPKHPMYRTKQCFSFHYKGFCLYGSRCQFLHDVE